MLSPTNEKSESSIIQTIKTTISKQMIGLKLMLEKISKFQPEVEQKRADQANTSKLQVLSEAEWLELYNQ